MEFMKRRRLLKITPNENKDIHIALPLSWIMITWHWDCARNRNPFSWNKLISNYMVNTMPVYDLTRERAKAPAAMALV